MQEIFQKLALSPMRRAITLEPSGEYGYSLAQCKEAQPCERHSWQRFSLHFSPS
jgi:hypothetical protein